MSFIPFERLIVNAQTDRQPTDSTHKFTSYLRQSVGNGSHNSRKLAMRVVAVSIPNVAYQISYADSRLYFQTKDFFTQEITENFIQIDYDKYYADSNAFAAYLTSAFTDQHSLSVLVEFDENTQTLKITNNINNTYFRFVSDRKYEPTGLNGSILASRGNMKFGLISDYRESWLGPNAFFHARGSCQLRRTDVIHIASDTLSTNTLTPSGYAAAPILITVPAGPYGTTTVYTPPVKEWHIINDNTIDSIKFELFDSNFIPYDIRESNVMLIIEFATAG